MVRTEQEALYIACEMEASAVQLYTRALALLEQLGRAKEPLYARVQQILDEEKGHLKLFRTLYQGLDAQQEAQLALAAVAGGVLFEGGLMGAVRKGLLSDERGMLDFAAASERTAAQKYRQFAQAAQAREALLDIASQEDNHLDQLEAALEKVK